MRATPHTRIDAGLGQINLGYHKHRFTGACDLLDPYRNLAVAAEILKEQHTPARTGCWRSAATTARRRRARRPLSAQRVAPPCPRAGHATSRRGPRGAPGDLPMTKPHPAHLAFTGLLMLLSGLPLASRAGEPLIVVEDRGGTSALPYYEALNLQPRANAPARPSIPTPQVPATRADEAAMLPVRSAKLTPGTVARRVIEAPGLRPFVVIGDDEASRAWLQRRAAAARTWRGRPGRQRRDRAGPGAAARPGAGRAARARGRRRPGRSPGPAALPGADHGHRHRAMKPCRANSRSRFCYAQRWSYTPSRRVQAPRFCAWWPHGRSR